MAAVSGHDLTFSSASAAERVAIMRQRVLCSALRHHVCGQRAQA